MKLPHIPYLGLIVCSALFLMVGCKAIQKQVSEIQAFTKCRFRIGSVNNIRLAGVDVQNVRTFNNLSVMNVATLTSAYLGKNMPLSFVLNIDGQNPGTTQAALGGFDWQLLIDGQQFLTGNNPTRVTIAPNGGTTAIPMQINLELFKALSGKSKDAVMNFGLALAGQNGQSSRIALRIKPSFIVNGYTFALPNYVEIGKDFKPLK